MLEKRLNVAIVHPLENNTYSETFIIAQKELLPFNIFYYYGSNNQKKLEGVGAIISNKRIDLYLYKIKRWLKLSSLDFISYQISKSFLKNRIDIVLSQYGPNGQSYVKICKDLNLPLIVNFFGYDAVVKEVIERNHNYKELFAYASKVICVSKAMVSSLVAIGCSVEKLTVNVCGPSEMFFDINAQITKPHFIGVGRFTDKKAPYFTILSFSKVLKSHPEARLTLIGNGMLFNTCRNLVDYLNIAHAVDLPGVKPQNEYMRLFNESIAFVQHSIVAENGDSEGTPVAVLEASAAGLPVISTKHAGIAEVIVDGQTGLLVDEHDVNGMAKAMIKVLENKDLARKMGDAGKERVQKKYSMQRHIDKLAQIIEGSV